MKHMHEYDVSWICCCKLVTTSSLRIDSLCNDNGIMLLLMKDADKDKFHVHVPMVCCCCTYCTVAALHAVPDHRC